MQDKPLERDEQELLDVIHTLHAQRGPIPRAALSVEARGRGIEVARPIGRLKARGLVEEVVKQPSWLRWLLGARAVTMVRPVQTPEVEPDIAAEPAPLDAVAQEPTPAPPIDAPVEAEAIAAPEPVPPPAPIAPQPAPRARLLPPVTAFTEDLGGAPVMPVARPQIDEAVLDDLREMLDGVGMELTMAGEALVADRMAKGATAAEALLQVMVYAFAHAVRLDVLAEGAVDALGLSDYLAEVMRELGRLHTAGAIGDMPFETDMAHLRILTDTSGDRVSHAEQLLTDPVGGAAPPALLPEDLRLAEEGDASDW